MAVQEHDTAADQLRYRRASLPELARLKAVEDNLAGLEPTLTEAAGAANEAARKQRRLEADLALVESKVSELEARLYSGAITVPRELQAMQAEADALRARRASLEDEVLKAMEERESLDEEINVLRQRRAELDAEGVGLRATVAEVQSGLDRDLAAEQEARSSAVSSLPADLVALYERLRARLGGVAAAPLVNGRCGGCHLALPATEVDRLRKEPPEILVLCEQCERILVRP